MSRIDELIEQARGLEEEIQAEFDREHSTFLFIVDERRIRFSEEVAQLQRASRTGLVRYITGSTLLPRSRPQSCMPGSCRCSCSICSS